MCSVALPLRAGGWRGPKLGSVPPGGAVGITAGPPRLHRCPEDAELAMMRARMNPPSQQAGIPNCQLRCAGLV